jgi:hypothetical protein
VDPDVQELGRQLAVARRARRSGPKLRRDQHRWAVHSVPQCRSGMVEVRPDLQHLPELRLLKHGRGMLRHFSCGSVQYKW